MRRVRAFSFQELLLSLLAPGFLLAVGWTVMYEVYHDEGAYYTTLMQEILAGEGLFPYFLIAAILMALPLGMIVDSVRHVMGERWLGIPRGGVDEGARDLGPAWIRELDKDPGRYLLYRHARAMLFVPAQAAGNLAVVLVVFWIWFVVKVIRIGGWHLFSPAFLILTPVVGLAIIVALVVRYDTGLRSFHQLIRQPSPTEMPGASAEAAIPPRAGL